MYKLIPLFDAIQFHVELNQSVVHALNIVSVKQVEEYKALFTFLANYTGSVDTFNTYRREIERFFHWSWIFKQKGVLDLDALDLTQYVKFCRNPPKDWCSVKQEHRFIDCYGDRQPNTKWRPFKLNQPLSDKSLQVLLASLGTLYTYLQQEGIIMKNPVQMMRQKTRLIRQHKEVRITRKLTANQWHYVIITARKLADKNKRYERHLFLLSAFFLMGVRISELATTDRHQPLMTHFIKDQFGCVWYATVGKGNKYREIAVSDEMLKALHRYRKSLSLTLFPLPTEQTPLCPKMKGQGGLGVRQIRYMVQEIFDAATELLVQEGHADDAVILKEATVHWLRHTSISADVQHRPREHVRDDAGHESVVITDKYIDVDRMARHNSAKSKKLIIE